MKLRTSLAAALSAGALVLVPAASATAGPAATGQLSAHVPDRLAPVSPLGAPAGGTLLITYYSDAAHSQVVGQATGSSCPSRWGVQTSFYTVAPIPC